MSLTYNAPIWQLLSHKEKQPKKKKGYNLSEILEAMKVSLRGEIITFYYICIIQEERFSINNVGLCQKKVKRVPSARISRKEWKIYKTPVAWKKEIIGNKANFKELNTLLKLFLFE